MPLKAQNDYIFLKLGVHGPFFPLATPMLLGSSHVENK